MEIGGYIVMAEACLAWLRRCQASDFTTPRLCKLRSPRFYAWIGQLQRDGVIIGGVSLCHEETVITCSTRCFNIRHDYYARSAKRGDLLQIAQYSMGCTWRQSRWYLVCFSRRISPYHTRREQTPSCTNIYTRNNILLLAHLYLPPAFTLSLVRGRAPT